MFICVKNRNITTSWWIWFNNVNRKVNKNKKRKKLITGEFQQVISFPKTFDFLLCQQIKKISSSIWLSSRSCCVLGGQGPDKVSRVLPKDLGVVKAGLCCVVLVLWVDNLLCIGAETGLNTSNNSTKEKSNLQKRSNLLVFFVSRVEVPVYGGAP